MLTNNFIFYTFDSLEEGLKSFETLMIMQQYAKAFVSEIQEERIFN